MTSLPSLVLDPEDDIQTVKPEVSLRYNDKYVVNYDFSDVGKPNALPPLFNISTHGIWPSL